MVDGTQPQGDPPQAFPGLAEIFAISYRTQWKARNLTPPDALFSQSYRIRPPLPLEAACGNIVQMLQQKPSQSALPDEFKRLTEPALYKLNVGRLALAQLSRATRLEGAPATVPSLLYQLATALEMNQDFGRIQDDYAAELNAGQQQTDPNSGQTALTPPELLPRFDADMFRDSLDGFEVDTADTRFFRAFAHPSLRLLNGRNSPPPKLRNYAVSHSYQDRVTDTEACVDVDRPAQELFEVINPQRWHANLPTLWPKPTVFLQGVPVDRNNDGVTRVAPGPIPDNVELPFFEEAMFGWGVLPVTCYRNLLNVSVDGTQKPNAASFTYRQRSCLTAQFFGISKQAGGIDVDRGTASCANLTGAEAGWCRFRARKASRFDLPTDPLLNRLYNDIAAVGLSLLIEAFVLFGAVAPTPAP